MFAALAEHIGAPALATDARFATTQPANNTKMP